jgi:hypothetical protein
MNGLLVLMAVDPSLSHFSPLPFASLETALLSAAERGQFQVVLVDDLSRLARDNYLMLSVLAELHFASVRFADGLDSHDGESTLGHLAVAKCFKFHP